MESSPVDPKLSLPTKESPDAMISPTSDPASSSKRYNNYPKYAPRIWHGMTISSWFQLLLEHRFRVNRYPMSSWITFFSVVNSASNRVQSLRFGRQAKQTPLVDDPIFILGHWRTGTTLLHSLFQLDPTYWAPSTYECLSPGHFMVTENLFPQLMEFPARRPMDNMSMGWTQPQEDEFVLCTRGLPSVYRNIAFPYDRVTCVDSLTMENASDRMRTRWKKTLDKFVRYLNVARHRQLVLKSPTHTGRIKLLLELYPNAKFVHLARDPQEFIPSTLYLWRALEVTNGLIHDANDIDREQYVFDCLHQMYQGFDEAKQAIPAGNYCELTYPELTEDTEAALGRVYDQLSLGDFDRVAGPIRNYMAERSDYQRNRHEVSPELVERIRSEAAFYSHRFLSEHESSQEAA
jgi:hypothetical protein